MQEKEIDKEKSKKIAKILKKGETGKPIQKTDYTKFRRKGVYNRKILRSMLKHAMGTNKIKNAWHQLRAEGRI